MSPLIPLAWSTCRETPTALVLVAGGGLFDPTSNQLVREVRERLGGVFVTRATAEGAPSLDDALAAARYMGAGAAVVIRLDGGAARRAVPAADEPLRLAWARCAAEPAAVEDAYRHGVLAVSSDRAAFA